MDESMEHGNPMENIVRVLQAVRQTILNMGIYPGLFALINEWYSRLTESNKQEIAKIVSHPMTGADVDHIFAIMASINVVEGDGSLVSG